MEATITGVKTIPISPNTKLEEIIRIFNAQQKNRQAVKDTTAKERKAKLKKMIDTVLEYRTKIQDAVYADLRKPAVETDWAVRRVQQQRTTARKRLSAPCPSG